MGRLYFFFFLFFITVSKVISTTAEYPQKIYEIGGVVVTQPILDFAIEGAVFHTRNVKNTFPNLSRSLHLYSNFLAHVSLESICAYFMHQNVLKIINGEYKLRELDFYFVEVLKFYTNRFNLSILEGITEPARIIAFSVVFLRLFKASYPGLENVCLSRNEIKFLTLIAAGWFMDQAEGEDNDLDIFMAKCFKFYSADCSAVPLPKFDLSLAQFYELDCKFSFEAALQLDIKGIRRRNNISYILQELTPEKNLEYFLNVPIMFSKLLPLIKNINEVKIINPKQGQDYHILIVMIKKGFFYPEAMLRPELKDLRITFNYYYYYFEDFYSEALYQAIVYRNISAVHFLLRLDGSYFTLSNNNDSDFDAVDDYFSGSEQDLFLNSYHPKPIHPSTLSQLRAIFLSESIEELIAVIPNIMKFSFLRLSIHEIISIFKNHHSGITKLSHYLNRLIEEKYRESITFYSPMKCKQNKKIYITKFQTIYE